MNTPERQYAQNIYQMYEANGNKAGFFVRRNSWGNTYARVATVAGSTEGPLPGNPPYYGNPPVTMDVFNDDGSLKGTDQELSCPGTYSYKRFEPEPRRQ